MRCFGRTVDDLQEQISKLQGQAEPHAKKVQSKLVDRLPKALRDERAKAGIDRLQQLLVQVRGKTPAAESKAVRDIEASLKQAETDWKELSPIYQKWQAGRHSFRSNADLQAFKRRYEECRKIRDAGDEKLGAALCARRGADIPEEPPNVPKAGWSSIARKAQTMPAAQSTPVRGAAAVALDAKKKGISQEQLMGLADNQLRAATQSRGCSESATSDGDRGRWLLDGGPAHGEAPTAPSSRGPRQRRSDGWFCGDKSFEAWAASKRADQGTSVLPCELRRGSIMVLPGLPSSSVLDISRLEADAGGPQTRASLRGTKMCRCAVATLL